VNHSSTHCLHNQQLTAFQVSDGLLGRRNLVAPEGGDELSFWRESALQISDKYQDMRDELGIRASQFALRLAHT